MWFEAAWIAAVPNMNVEVDVHETLELSNYLKASFIESW